MARKPTKKQREAAEDRVAAQNETEAAAESGQIPLTHKYRPWRISDFAGQDQAVEVLTDIFTSGRIPHAFLIEGPTGTGKTTISRFISMRVNCRKPKGVDPCGKCESCKKYRRYPDPAHPAHVEINASSNGRIAEIRDLIRQSGFRVMHGHKRILHLDETHGMSHDAKQALLKPLEDPNRDTIWILSTTDPGKLPSAMIGRCRAGHIRVRPPTTESLAKRLLYIVKAEGAAKAMPKKDWRKWCKRIAVSTNHQPRDAVACLEQVLNAIKRRTGKKVDLEKILPRIVDEVQQGNPWRVALEVAAAVLADNSTSALKAAKESAVEAHVLLGALCTVWEQVLVLGVAGRNMLDPYYARTLPRVFHDYEVDIGPDDMPGIVRAGEFLAKQYERSKSFIVPGPYLTTLTVTGMWELAAIIDEDDEDEDED